MRQISGVPAGRSAGDIEWAKAKRARSRRRRSRYDRARDPQHRSLAQRSPFYGPISRRRCAIACWPNLTALQSADEAAEWAHRSLPAKNTLATADAELVEAGFRLKLAAFGDGRFADGPREAAQSQPGVQSVPSGPEAEAPLVTASAVPALSAEAGSGQDTDNAREAPGELNEHPASGVGGGIDKSVLAIGEPRRIRDKGHRKFVSSQACLICGRQPSDPHHLRSAQPRALGRKVSDEFTVPLCRTHHREVHRVGDEAAWWSRFGVDPYLFAAALWAQSRLGQSVGELPNPPPLAARPAGPPDPDPLRIRPMAPEIAKRSQLLRPALNDHL